MKIILICVLVFTLFTPAYSQGNKAQTQIIVIGTVHVETGNFNSDTLLNIFNKIKPDVFLVECDSSYMTSDFILKEDVMYAFPETKAITGYLSVNSAELRPYDITDRDLFMDQYERLYNQRHLFEDIESLSMKGKMNNYSINILNKILAMMNTAEEMTYSTSTYINSVEGSKKIDTINYYTYTGLTELVKAEPGLSIYRDYRKSETDFWERRNNIMLENILMFKRSFEGRKIVVLCGFSHKNFLVNGLKKKASEEDLIVKEFSEF